MATSKERQIERDKQIAENGKKLQEVLEKLEQILTLVSKKGKK